MKIIVCIKSVLDVSFPFVLDQDKLLPLDDDVFYTLNPADKCAVEVALNLKEEFGGEVIILSYGPGNVETALRDCLAMGGDSAVRVWNDQPNSGSSVKAYLLAKAIETLSADLVMCGSMSLDEGTGETPAVIAEFLNISQVTGVTDLSYGKETNTVTVKRKLERGWREEIECPLPAVLSVELGIRQPRYGQMPNVLEAKLAKIDCLTADDVGADLSFIRELDSLVQFESRSLPRPRPKKTFNMESGLTAEQRMELMMAGGLKQSKSDLLEGFPKELGEKLANILKDRISVRSD